MTYRALPSGERANRSTVSSEFSLRGPDSGRLRYSVYHQLQNDGPSAYASFGYRPDDYSDCGSELAEAGSEPGANLEAFDTEVNAPATGYNHSFHTESWLYGLAGGQSSNTDQESWPPQENLVVKFSRSSYTASQAPSLQSDIETSLTTPSNASDLNFDFDFDEPDDEFSAIDLVDPASNVLLAPGNSLFGMGVWHAGIDDTGIDNSLYNDTPAELDLQEKPEEESAVTTNLGMETANNLNFMSH